MNKHMLSSFRNALLGLVLGALPVANALAADIEIYVGNDTEVSGVRPNILFVLDTSGSMDTLVYTQVPYDPNTVYEGECTSDAIYVSNSRYDPKCGYRSTVQHVEDSYFVCQAATNSLNLVGRYQDVFAQWVPQSKSNKSKWKKNINSSQRYVECKADNGKHGQTDGSSAKWPGDGNNGPFTSNSKNGIKWNGFSTYTAYTGNYINWLNDPDMNSVRSRIDIMKDVFKETLDSINNVNVGLMRFDRYANGGMVVHEVANLNTARSTLKSQIDGMSAGGNTPLAETMYEAALYFLGEPVYFGNSSSPVKSVSGARNGSNYKSPIEYQCQKNFIVYLTDGEPTSDTGADSRIRSLTGRSCSSNCLDELADYLYTQDLHSGLSGKQNVITYTIGFATNQQLLNDAARKGGGKYYTADNTAELSTALTRIVAEVLAVNSTFTAPAVSVNAFNRTVHLDQLFFTIFKPSERPHWDGNLKRFDLGNYDGELLILDKNNQPAVDPNTGFFKDTAVSWWTLSDQSPDGGEARLGGAAGQISLPRKVYTWLGSAKSLKAGDNAFSESNPSITKSMLGIDGATDSYRTELLKWARGVDLDDEDDDGQTSDGRRIMGDPLHSKPVVVTYGGSDDTLDFTVFMTTNDGYLHAIDAQTGQEHFAFIPKEVFPNLDKLYQNNAATDSKIYGLDSPITAWINDVNGNGIVESDDHVYIYFGQRRGGSNYYALDVSDRDDPQVLWQINDQTAGFAELGQSWSQPRVAKVNVGGTVRDVVIFAGGYDTNQDSAHSYSEDSRGRAVFMVDARTGALIWRAGPSGSGANLVLADMKNSIPSEVRVIDVNADGLADRMYVGDTGGRIFRFDIINGQSGNDLVKGGVIASLGGAAEGASAELDNRKFFHAPDAALMIEDTRRWINIAIGSGNQSHPLGKMTQDRLYSLRDTNVYNVPETYEVITNDKLYDATDNLIGEGDRAAELAKLEAKEGWYIDLESSGGTLEGEKSLAESTTFQGNIYFTTFTPVGSGQTSSCAPSQGTARTYVVSARDGTPVHNFNGTGDDDNLTKEDRALTLVRGGIPPEVTILFPESNNGQPIALVGPEQLPLNLSNTPVRTYWYEVDSKK